jgi:hypothetical protein
MSRAAATRATAGLGIAAAIATCVAACVTPSGDQPARALRWGNLDEIEEACAVTARTCSRCHDIEKVAIAHFDASLAWRRLILRMRRMPASGISDAEVHAAETCLVFQDLGRRGLDELASLEAAP